MSERSGAPAVDDYIAGFPAETRALLEEMRGIIRSVAPEATETMSYAIPTFDLNGKHLVHFAAFKNHAGLYPTPSGMEAFAGDLAQYKAGKGSARFPLGKPLPAELIRRVVEFRVREVTE